MFLYSYNAASQTAKELARTMGVRRIRHENSNFRGGPTKTVLNYGSSSVPDEVAKSRIINRPERIALASNKRTFFEQMRDAEDGPRIPDWTTSRDQAAAWVLEGHLIVARTVLQGHSGEGIVLMHRDNPDEYVNAPLYTKYVKKKDEYRVHIVNGEIIDFARKAIRSDFPKDQVNHRIRNHANGFVYVRGGVELPNDIQDQAVKAMNAIGLDYGAVDVIFNNSQGQAYVLEINTAPGMEGTTLQRYSEAFLNNY